MQAWVNKWHTSDWAGSLYWMYGRRPARMSRYVLENSSSNEEYELDVPAWRLKGRTMGEWERNAVPIDRDKAWMNIHFGRNGTARP